MQLLEFARSRRGGELIGLVVLATGIMLLLALVTYHTDDSSAFHTSTNTVVANAIGYYGATIAWLFVSFFGFASLLFPAALLVIGWQRLRALNFAWPLIPASYILVGTCMMVYGVIWQPVPSLTALATVGAGALVYRTRVRKY